MYTIRSSNLLYFIPDTESKRRKTILTSLNERFAELIKFFRISESYSKIVNSKPYKVLSSYAFDWTFVPLKRRFEEMALSPKPTAKRRKGNPMEEEFQLQSHRYILLLFCKIINIIIIYNYYS